MRTASKKMQMGGTKQAKKIVKKVTSMAKAGKAPAMKKMQNGGANTDPLSGKGRCKMGECGPSAGGSRGAARQKSSSARSFSKPKFKRTKVRF